MSPETLKAIRAHFGLTRKQVADCLNIDSRTWYRWEQGTEQIPDKADRRIIKFAHRLTAARLRRAKLCPYCRRDIQNRTDHRCPYCDRVATRTSKQLTAEVLPVR